MAAYRLYRVDGAGRFTTAEWFEAEADEAALSQAQALTAGHFEVWDRGRLVGRSAGSR